MVHEVGKTIKKNDEIADISYENIMDTFFK